MFAIALWDSARRRLFLARDRLGIKPLVYYEGRGALVFASEAKALLHSGELSARLEPAVLKDLRTFGYVLSPRTWFAGVRSLPPGHRLVYAGGRSTVEPYWGISFPAAAERSPPSADEWAEGLREKMEETVRIHLRSDVPVGVWLSPGIDSSAVAGLTARMTGGSVPAFSIGFEDRECDELESGRTLADFPEYGLEGRTVRFGSGDFDDLPEIVRHGESMSALGLEVPRWVLARASARHVKVVLTGEGADEILGGYGWYRAERLFAPFHRLPSFLRRVLSAAMRLHPRWKPNTARQFLSSPPTGLDRYQGIVGVPWNAESESLLAPDRRREGVFHGEDRRPYRTDPPGFRDWPPFAQLQYRDLTVRMPDYIVHHLDRMTMAHSLEARVPFLDHELVEYCASVPPDLKMKGLVEKDVLRNSMKGLLPGEILTRPKRGMTSPLESWLRGSLPDFAQEMLSAERVRRKGYFSPETVSDLLRRHRRGEPLLATRIMAVLVVHLWDEIFLRKPLTRS